MQLSLRFMRAEGFVVQVVERWDPWSKRRHDLFRFADIIAIQPGKSITLIQTTTTDNMSARLKKIESIEASRIWLLAGGAIEVHGWEKIGRRWELTVSEVE